MIRGILVTVLAFFAAWAYISAETNESIKNANFEIKSIHEFSQKSNANKSFIDSYSSCVLGKNKPNILFEKMNVLSPTLDFRCEKETLELAKLKGGEAGLFEAVQSSLQWQEFSEKKLSQFNQS